MSTYRGLWKGCFFSNVITLLFPALGPGAYFAVLTLNSLFRSAVLIVCFLVCLPDLSLFVVLVVVVVVGGGGGGGSDGGSGDGGVCVCVSCLFCFVLIIAFCLFVCVCVCV